MIASPTTPPGGTFTKPVPKDLFGELAHRWWEGVATGSLGKRTGAGAAGYSPTALKGYERTLRSRLVPEFGGRHAAELVEIDWQLWVDLLSEEGFAVPDRESRREDRVPYALAFYGGVEEATQPAVDPPHDRA